MTINAIVPRLLWVGNGATSARSLSVDGEPITFLMAAHIVVRQRVMATGDVTTLTSGIDYDITGGPVISSDAPPATLTRIGGNLPSGYVWAVLRATPISQEVAIGGAFSAADIESIGNRGAEVSQDIAEKVSRALVLPPFAVGASPELPMPAASAILAWNAAGNGFENKEPAAIGAATFPVASTDNAIARFDGTSGSSLQDSGVIVDDNDNISWSGDITQAALGGFWTDVSPFVNIARLDRLFVGEARNASGAGFAGSPSQGSIIPTSAEGANWILRDSQLLCIHEQGNIAIAGISRSSDRVALPSATIGVAGGVINDGGFRGGSPSDAWALYGDVQHEVDGVNISSFGLELAVKNKGTTNSGATAYDSSGLNTLGLHMVGGGDPSYGGAATHPCSIGMSFSGGPSTVGWNTGIVFFNGSLADLR